ncbi:uncharacterized protein LOC121185402 isoform X2 [Toxotes jaculatrix]|uniref:uncharacterized protein LOC121185402 isoform X2 n=1 Tax=Toxotes jaculatrix TaxID=941984 RepID=UPI001B3AF140|nr:uncharacterized protein LOC121185402 isoform X2 [Toxotes jaculatrix]
MGLTTWIFLYFMVSGTYSRVAVHQPPVLTTALDTMIFNLTNNNESLLRCEVNVTREPGFVLSISHNGNKLQTVDLVPGDDVAALPYVTLSQTISLQSGGKYECQLHLNDDIITKNIFNYLPSTRSEEGGDAEKNIFTPRQPVSESGEGKFPEPWLLYAALLLVPSTVLLSLIIALMMCKRRV